MGAANGDANRLPVDYFAVRATTQVEFDGTSHLFRVNGDDGFQILAKHKGTNEQYFITPEKQWIQAFDAPYEVEYTLPAGQYDLTFNYYEATEAANLDFSWQKSAIQPDPISSSPSPNPTSSNQSSSPFPSPSPAPSDKPSSSQMGSSLWDNPLYYYPLTSKYGQRTYWNGSQWVSGFHRGIDIGTGDETPAVEAARKGTVTEAAIGWNGGYGNLVTIDHGDGLETRYAHLSSIAVKVGDRVDTSTVIGSVGSTGNSTGNHLHFEIRVDGEDKNPEEFISFA
ncbi:MAG: M23 family metallopeptidase [Cyanobacteria bacterium CRU_2_1]|nr:M23 family metallopeptidase [Cyanobacteria bacterium RU_5_0]NJR60138.1 M23 family metallopeptidase [Cyanobacteria bacterium CRU_2_1]